ncbi:MAG: traN [Daejeonella sp.]|nr:traN [Daejeonella sp.]
MEILRCAFCVLAFFACHVKSYGQNNFLLDTNLLQNPSTLTSSITAVTCRKLARDPAFRCIAKDKNSQIEARLSPVVISNNELFFKVRMDNQSNISFDIDFIRFYIRDIKTAKRTVTQEQEVRTVHQYGLDRQTIDGNASQVFVFAFRKFTLTNKKAFYIEIYEKSGGRHLNLKAMQPDIAKAITIK